MAADKMAIYSELESRVDNICNDKGCASCDGVCLMKYAKEYINICRELQKREVPNGHERIPTEDFKHYDQEIIIDGIARMLAMCHDCENDHSADCVINVVRSCFEHAVIGDTIDYPGNALMYIMKLQNETELAGEIMEKYKEYKNN